MYNSRFGEEMFLVNCDACEDFSGEFRINHFMILALGWSEDKEFLFYVISDILISRESVFLCCHI